MFCLNEFTKIQDIYEKYKKTLEWYIVEARADYRANQVSHMNYFIKFKKQAIKKEIEVNDNEIISWLDSLSLLIRLLDTDILKDDLKNKTKVIQEYKIMYSNNYRADYLLMYENKVVILEFSYKINNEKFDEKLYQVIRYKEIIESQLPRDVQIAPYVFIYKPEKCKDTNRIIDHYVDENNEEIENLAKFLNNFFQPDYAYNKIKELK